MPPHPRWRVTTKASPLPQIDQWKLTASSKSDEDLGFAIRIRGFSRFLWPMQATG